MWSQAPSGPGLVSARSKPCRAPTCGSHAESCTASGARGPDPAQVLEVISPAGFERLFEDLGGLLERTPEPSEEEVVDICGRYGLTLDASWVPDLEARFGAMRMVCTGHCGMGTEARRTAMVGWADATDRHGRRRGPGAAHGTESRWLEGCDSVGRRPGSQSKCGSSCWMAIYAGRPFRAVSVTWS